MTEFNVGDQVRLIDYPDAEKIGSEGTVTQLHQKVNDAMRVRFEWSRRPHGSRVYEEEIELVESKPQPKFNVDHLELAYDTMKAAYFELELDRDYHKFWHEKKDGDLRQIRRAFDLISGGQR